MQSKICFKCGVDKPLVEFYRHPRMGDGHLNKCKECTKKDTKENKAANYEYYRLYDIERSKLPHRREACRNRLPMYRSSFPDRHKAHQEVRKAIKNGLLSKLPCFVCGSEKTEAHHPDYSSPLDVIWLCPRHHKEAHAIAHYSGLKAA